MASKLIAITAEERIPLLFGESDDPDHATVYYRRIPSRIRREMVTKHTTLGVTNWYACGMDFANYAVVGWDNVQDASGKPLTFHKDLIGFLTDDAITDVLNKLNENAPAFFLSS